MSLKSTDGIWHLKHLFMSLYFKPVHIWALLYTNKNNLKAKLKLSPCQGRLEVSQLSHSCLIYLFTYLLEVLSRYPNYTTCFIIFVQLFFFLNIQLRELKILNFGKWIKKVKTSRIDIVTQESGTAASFIH